MFREIFTQFAVSESSKPWFAGITEFLGSESGRPVTFAALGLALLGIAGLGIRVRNLGKLPYKEYKGGYERVKENPTASADGGLNSVVIDDSAQHIIGARDMLKMTENPGINLPVAEVETDSGTFNPN